MHVVEHYFVCIPQVLCMNSMYTWVWVWVWVWLCVWVCVCDVMNVLYGRRCLVHVVEHYFVCIPQVLNIYICVCVCVGGWVCVCVTRCMCWMNGGL